MTVELREQLAWEKEMVNLGVARFRNQETKALERKDYTGTNGGKRLLTGYLSQVSEFIAHYCAGNNPNGRRRSKYASMVALVAPDKIAMFALGEIVRCVYTEASVVDVAHRIGVMIEDELRFTAFELAKPELFSHLQRDLDSRNSENYRHRHRVLTHSMNKHNIEWASWGNDTCAGVGALVLGLTLEATDLVSKETIRKGRKAQVVLRATPEVMEWVEKSDEAIAVMMPDRMPCLIPPDDWTDPWNGGYHLPRLRSNTPLVKVRRGFSKAPSNVLLSEAEMGQVLSAVNAMQRTAWQINQPVLDALQAVWEANLGIGMPPSQPYEVPACPFVKGQVLSEPEQERLNDWKVEAREVHALEQHRQGLVLSVARTMRIGEMLRARDEFYYVYQLDFRSRTYSATSGVSPQGDDVSKGVLQFARAKELGPDGMYWLCVHGANKFGTDKCSNDDRVAWIEERRDQWIMAASDPVGYRDAWKDADKPYQFLAFCIEYAAAVEVGPTFKSRLPIALDGSCNGLQHFSAMLRDLRGGAAVNLLPGDTPSDIYQDVADVATRELERLAQGSDDEATAARNWLALFTRLGYKGMPRKASKKPVMTLPYGATQQACTGSLFSWYMEHRIKFFPEGTAFKHCIFMSQILWDSIGKVVVAARAAMDWIQKAASMVAKAGLPLIYTNYLGFPVYQGSRKNDVVQVQARVGGSRSKLNVVVEKDEIDSRKQRQGSSPNLVHNTDAPHMHMCINAGVEYGIEDFAMVHDDFGVHACYITKWNQIIREQFVELHTKWDVLAEFKAALELQSGLTLPPLPDKGSLDLAKVLESKYFFG